MLVRTRFVAHIEQANLFSISGDPQSALGQYGDVLLLLQLLIARYEVILPSFNKYMPF